MTRRAAAALVIAALVTAALAPASPAAKRMRIRQDIVVRSSDGTKIVATLMFPAGASRRHPVPVVMMTHGWGGHREHTPSPMTRAILRRGYAVLTYDSRGFGESGGEAHVGSPGFEVADARALISYLAGVPSILKERRRDPALGWIGASNAAGVQFNTTAFDRRVDAIIPVVSWGNLPQDLLPNGIAKITWTELLYAGGLNGALGEGLQSPAGPDPGNYARQIHEAHTQLVATGRISDNLRRWFAHKSTTRRSQRIKAPTLIIQGTIDTLFPLQDGFRNFRKISKAGTRVKLITFCNGHTLTGCPYPGDDTGYPKARRERRPLWFKRALAWLDRYVKGRRKAPVGPRIEWQAQDGYYYRGGRYPLRRSRMRWADHFVTGSLVGPGPGGGDGPADANPAPDRELGSTAFRAKLLGRSKRPRAIVGIPKATVRATVTGAQAHLYFELVDVKPSGERVTLDDQVMPLKLGSGRSRHRIALHGVSWMLKPGHKLELEVTTGSRSYEDPRTGGFEVHAEIHARVPVKRLRVPLRALRTG